MRWAFLFFAALVLAGCSQPGNIILNEEGDISVYFCPRDDCMGKVVSLVNDAKSSVHCAFYDLDLNDIISALSEKAKEIDVKSVIDDENIGSLSGSSIRQDIPKHTMHNKFCIIDSKVVWAGSFNPTERGNFHNNNNMVVFRSSYLAQNYEDEFI